MDIEPAAEVVAIVEDAATERHEDSGETAVELATIEAETRETEAEARVEIAEAEAAAAVGVAEAYAQGNEEWRAEAESLRAQLALANQNILALTEQMSALATTSSTPTIIEPPAEPPPTTEIVVEPPEMEAPGEPAPVAGAGPRESRAGKVRTRVRKMF